VNHREEGFSVLSFHHIGASAGPSRDWVPPARALAG
jgi:hypothetical protein